MDVYDFPEFTDTSSFYGHNHQTPLSTSASATDNPFYDFITPNMTNSMARSSANATGRSQDQSFPPVDSILYSPIDDWTQVTDYSSSDAFGLQSLFSESPLMSTLERQSSSGGDSASTTTPAANINVNSNAKASTTGSLSTSPGHEHIDVAGWEPTPEQKRSKSGTDSEAKSACWTSPLCPAYGKPGPHPNPSTCEGGCAPNLFDDQSMDQWFENIDKMASNEDPSDLLDTQFTTAVPDPSDASPAVLVSELSKGRNAIKKEDDFADEPLSKTRPKRRPTNKRGSSEESSSSPNSTAAAAPTAKPSRRQPHNEIEKKYRESINTHLEALKNSIPAFQQPKNQCMQGKGDIEDLAAAPKPSKSIILASAVAHIKKIEKEKRQVEQERNLLRQQVKALQALVKCDDCSLMQYVLNLNLGSAGNVACRGGPRMS